MRVSKKTTKLIKLTKNNMNINMLDKNQNQLN